MRKLGALIRVAACLAIFSMPLGVAHAQINVITVDATPFVSPGFSSFGPQNTMGMALQAVDQGGDFNVTEVTPAIFAAMTAGALAVFDLIAINNDPTRIPGGIGTTWQEVAGCGFGRTMLNSHDAPRFHMNAPTPGPPLFTGFEPFGAPALVRQAALWAGGLPGTTGLLIFNDALNFRGGVGWDNVELGPLPPAWGITDSGFQFSNPFPDGGYTLITAAGLANPVYNGALGVPLSSVRFAQDSISSFSANIGDGSFHSIFATFNAALFTPTEVVQNAGVVNVGGFPVGSLAAATGPDGTAITLICEDAPFFKKDLTSGPDADGDGETDIAIEVGQAVTTEYDFTITYSNPGGPPVLIIDTTPAEWVVTMIEGDDIGNGPDSLPVIPRGLANFDDGEGGSVDVFKTGKGAKSKSATRLEWTPDLTAVVSDIRVDVETRINPGHGKRGIDFFSPTSCGKLTLNDGAVAFEFDPQTGEIVLDQDGNPVIVQINGQDAITDSLMLVAVEDLNGGGLVGDGSGDEDGDGLTDADEAFNVGTDPCNPDTDGDGVPDNLDQCPLEGPPGAGETNVGGCNITD